MSEEEASHLIELNIAYERTLRKLELQAAIFGLFCPSYIKIEIEDVKREINSIQSKLKSSEINVNQNVYTVAQEVETSISYLVNSENWIIVFLLQDLRPFILAPFIKLGLLVGITWGGYSAAITVTDRPVMITIIDAIFKFVISSSFMMITIPVVKIITKRISTRVKMYKLVVAIVAFCLNMYILKLFDNVSFQMIYISIEFSIAIGMISGVIAIFFDLVTGSLRKSFLSIFGFDQ